MLLMRVECKLSSFDYIIHFERARMVPAHRDAAPLDRGRLSSGFEASSTILLSSHRWREGVNWRRLTHFHEDKHITANRVEWDSI